MLFDDGNQVAEYFAGFVLGKKEVVRSLQAGFKLAQVVIAVDKHGLRGLLTGTTLGTDIVSRRQGQRLAVPERRVVSCMIIGITAQDIEDEPGKQFLQCMALDR